MKRTLMTSGMLGKIQIINWKAANSVSFKLFQWVFRFFHFFLSSKYWNYFSFQLTIWILPSKAKGFIITFTNITITLTLSMAIYWIWPVSWVPLFIYLFVYFWPCHASCRILVTRPGVELGDLTVRAPSLNHWSAREFPMFNFKSIVSSIFSQTTEFIPLLRCLFTSPLLSLSDCERKSHTKSYSWNSLRLLFC